MIYLLLVVGFFGSIGFFIALHIYLFKSQDLGYLKYILLFYTYGSAICPLILYASIGTFYSWYKALWLYENLGWLYLSQILLAMAVYFSVVVYTKILEFKER